jgi:hypothetical protein
MRLLVQTKRKYRYPTQPKIDRLASGAELHSAIAGYDLLTMGSVAETNYRRREGHDELPVRRDSAANPAGSKSATREIEPGGSRELVLVRNPSVDIGITVVVQPGWGRRWKPPVTKGERAMLMQFPTHSTLLLATHDDDNSMSATGYVYQ